MSGRTWSSVALAGGLMVGAAGCRAATLPVHVTYSPKSDVEAKALTWFRPGMTVALGAVQDIRTRPELIGENIEEDDHVPILADPPSSVPRTVQLALQTEIEGLGLQLVGDGAAADRVLNATIVKLFVTEDNTYKAELRLSVQVLGPQGEERANILVIGASKRFGRSLSEENYQEAVSNAFVDAFEKLLENETFQGAMQN